jgi:hypothetical protein
MRVGPLQPRDRAFELDRLLDVELGRKCVVRICARRERREAGGRERGAREHATPRRACRLSQPPIR